MTVEPYWASQNIKKTGLTKKISSSPLQSTEQILESKRRVAEKVCKTIQREDSEAEIVAIIGSVAHGDIIGWFSDIDMLVITKEPRKEEMIEIDHDIVFTEYHSWKSFRELLVERIKRDEYEERSSYLFFYGHPRYLYSSAETEDRYSTIVNSGIESLWKDYADVDEYLDDFVWFYGSAIEAQERDKVMTAKGKLQRGVILLLRYYLVKNKILLRKPLPDERTMIQLRRSHVPKKLVDFAEEFHKGGLDIRTLLQHAEEMYLHITDNRKWLNKIPM